LINQKIEFLKVLKRPLAAVLEQTGREKAMVCPASLIVRPGGKPAGEHVRSNGAAAAHPRKKSA
jgi:hypothetical protein